METLEVVLAFLFAHPQGAAAVVLIVLIGAPLLSFFVGDQRWR